MLTIIGKTDPEVVREVVREIVHVPTPVQAPAPIIVPAPHVTRVVGYEVNAEGYIVRTLHLVDGEPTPANVVTVEYPDYLLRPRWLGGKWTEGSARKERFKRWLGF